MMRKIPALKDSLYYKYKKLVKEWHKEKNGSLTPKDVTPGSNINVWWKCKKGHEWQRKICHRTNNAGCPYCANKYPCKDNCLATVNPKLAKEWHPTKNGKLTPGHVLPGSGKKVWWKCKKGHEWKATVSSRNKGTACPYCMNKAVCKDNCLATVNPELVKEWHPTKNGKLTPGDVTARSGKKVWWKCKKGHEWQAFIHSRMYYNTGCPYCAGRFVCKDNCLATVDPELAKEWHPTKNGKLTPRDVTRGGGKKVWWKCKKGHAYQAVLAVKKHRTGCPYCINRALCKDNSLAAVHPELVKEWHPIKNGKLNPVDILFNSRKKVWWICKRGHEWQVAVYLRSLGAGCWDCHRRRATELHNLSVKFPHVAKEWHPVKNGSLTPEDVTPYSDKKVWWQCSKGHEWKMKVHYRSNGSKCPYCSHLRVCKDNCLATIKPELVKEWHPVKNDNLTPEDVTFCSNRKVWWQCKKKHEWKAAICSRTKGTRCPYCTNRKVCKDNCLATVNPKLAKEWHPVKNGTLTPEHVVPGSGKKVWWKCFYGHEWQSVIYTRSKGHGCPGCYRELVNAGFYSHKTTTPVHFRKK